MPTFATVKITPLARSGESRLLARKNNELFLCSENICLINKGGCLSPTTYPLFGRLRCNFDEFWGNGSRLSL